jgi:hypothetical protein
MFGCAGTMLVCGHIGSVCRAAAQWRMDVQRVRVGSQVWTTSTGTCIGIAVEALDDRGQRLKIVEWTVHEADPRRR